MKTNPSARRILKLRGLLICAALAAIIGLEVCLSESLCARIGWAAACQTESVATAQAGLADLMAAAR